MDSGLRLGMCQPDVNTLLRELKPSINQTCAKVNEIRTRGGALIDPTTGTTCGECQITVCARNGFPGEATPREHIKVAIRINYPRGIGLEDYWSLPQVVLV